MDEQVTVFARLEPELGAKFLATVTREERTQKAIVERALRAYIAKSEVEAQPAAIAGEKV